MITLDAHTAEERQALRAKNMETFKKHQIAMAKAIAKHTPATTLVFDDDGQPDVEFQGEKFYEGRYYDFVEEQVALFEKQPHRFNLAIPQPDEFDVYGRTFMTNILTRATKDLGAEFSRHQADIKSFFVTVMGIGLGGHIPMLQEKSDCTSLIIFDPNIEMFYHSLELVDWEPIYENCVSKGGRVEIVITTDPRHAFTSMRGQVRTTNAPSVDGMLLYTHFNHAFFAELMREVKKQANLFLAGLGFFDDECNMTKNTYANLSGGGAHIYTRQDNAIIEYPCFIVGCGPSLDADLPHIKRNADNAIVISCGSALGPLLNAGVVPDFQIEVENIGILPIMEHVASEHDISKICMVTSSTVEQGVKDYFDKIIYHFRPALTPYSIFSDDLKNTIPFHDPSVVNSGLGLAKDLGFRECYFFGCDMGTRDADNHHAKNSYHFTEGAQLPDNDFCIPVPANFGGNTFTSSGLFWVKNSLETAIAEKNTGRRYYNCSDGGFIEGTIAKMGKAVTLPEQPDPGFKAAFVQEFLDNSPVMTVEEFNEKWQFDTIRAHMDGILDALRDIIDGALIMVDKSYLVDINTILFHSSTAMERAIATWLRGSLQMILIALEYYSARLKGGEHDIAFEDIAREELVQQIEAMRTDAMAMLDELEAPSS